MANIDNLSAIKIYTMDDYNNSLYSVIKTPSPTGGYQISASSNSSKVWLRPDGWRGVDSPTRNITTASSVGGIGGHYTSLQWKPRQFTIPIQRIYTGSHTRHTDDLEQAIFHPSGSVIRFGYLGGYAIAWNAQYISGWDTAERHGPSNKFNLTFMTEYPFFFGGIRQSGGNLSSSYRALTVHKGVGEYIWGLLIEKSSGLSSGSHTINMSIHTAQSEASKIADIKISFTTTVAGNVLITPSPPFRQVSQFTNDNEVIHLRNTTWEGTMPPYLTPDIYYFKGSYTGDLGASNRVFYIDNRLGIGANT